MYNAHWIHSLPYSKFIELTLNMKVSFYASLTLRRGWNPKFGKKNCLKSSEHVLAQKNVKE